MLQLHRQLEVGVRPHDDEPDRRTWREPRLVRLDRSDTRGGVQGTMYTGPETTFPLMDYTKTTRATEGPVNTNDSGGPGIAGAS